MEALTRCAMLLDPLEIACEKSAPFVAAGITCAPFGAFNATFRRKERRRLRRRENCHGYRVTPGLPRSRNTVALRTIVLANCRRERSDPNRADRLRASIGGPPADAQDVRRDGPELRPAQRL